MTDDSVAFLSLAEQARRIAAGELSPVALVESCLARIERFDPTLKAFITVTAARARAEARTAESEIAAGRHLGPLHGIPVGIKDQMLIAGVRVTGGSKVHADLVAERDATVVARLKEAGAIVLGTLNTHEFHMGATVDFPYGTPRNPWNPERNPGGSSSGSAAAVAAGLCTVSLGGDTGGSVRGPAAWCGVVGLKPTWSRLSRDGVFPLAWTLDCVGPFARSVEDIAIVMRLLAGHDPLDPTSSREPVPDYPALLDDDLSGVRLGLVREMMAPDVVGAAARDAVLSALETLRERGAVVVEVALPLMTEARFLSPALTEPEAAAYHRRHLLERYGDYDVNTRIRLMVGTILPAGLVSIAQRARLKMAEQVRDALRDVDVLVGAGSSGGAPPLSAREPIRSKQEALEKLYGATTSSGQLTRVFNLSGHPAMSVPCGFDDGMPLSLHLAGRLFDEATVLRVGHAFERATDWHGRVPPIA